MSGRRVGSGCFWGGLAALARDDRSIRTSVRGAHKHGAGRLAGGPAVRAVIHASSELRRQAGCSRLGVR